jgi:hypothetical protein
MSGCKTPLKRMTPGMTESGGNQEGRGSRFGIDFERIQQHLMLIR